LAIVTLLLLSGFAAKIWLNAAIFAYAYRASKIGAYKPTSAAQVNSHSGRSNNASLGTDSTHSAMNGKNSTAAARQQQSRFTTAAPNSATRRTMTTSDAPISVNSGNTRTSVSQYSYPSRQSSVNKRGTSSGTTTSSSQQIHAITNSDEEQGTIHHTTTNTANTNTNTAAAMVPAVISRALFSPRSKGSVLTDEEKSARDHMTAYQNMRARVHGSTSIHMKSQESSTTLQVEEFQQELPTATGSTAHQQQSSTTRLLDV
jgi:IS5 family transposase